MNADWIGANGGVGSGESGNEDQPDQKNNSDRFGVGNRKELRQLREAERVDNAGNRGEQAQRKVQQEKIGEAIAARFWRSDIRAGKRIALGRKNSRPRERDGNGGSQQKSHHQESREARIE